MDELRREYEGHLCRCDQEQTVPTARGWVGVWVECHARVGNPDSPFCTSCEDRHPGRPVRVRPFKYIEGR